jgi:hypothetical protein
VLAFNVVPHNTHLIFPAANYSIIYKRTSKWAVKAVGFMERDAMPGSRSELTPFRIILATKLNFLHDIFRKPAPGLCELLSAGWALIHFLSAGVAYAMTILTH